MFSTKQIFAIKNFNKLLKKEKILIEKYIKNPDANNVIFFIYDDFQIKNSFHKKISQESLIVDIQTPFYSNKIKEWINYYLKINQYVLDNEVINFLIENYSDDLSNIFNEIEKLYLYKKNKNIKFDNFEVSYSNRHIKIWHLLNALGNKDLSASIRLFHNLLLNGISLIPILIKLTDFYSELLIENQSQSYNGLNKIINSRLKKYKCNYSNDEIKQIIVKMRNIDILLKSTSIKEHLLFVPFIIKVCKDYYAE